MDHLQAASGLHCIHLRHIQVPSSLLPPAVLALKSVLHHHYFLIPIFPQSHSYSRTEDKLYQMKSRQLENCFNVTFSTFGLSAPWVILWQILTIKSLTFFGVGCQAVMTEREQCLSSMCLNVRENLWVCVDIRHMSVCVKGLEVGLW